MTPARGVDIDAWHNGFYGETFEFTADNDAPVDLTGYSGKAQVRGYGAQGGTALITLPSVETAVEGVRIVEPSQGIVELRINEATLLSAYWYLDDGFEAGEAAVLAWDLVLTNPLGADEVWATGKFTINAGVTL